jgi:hypothetical protein
MQENHFVSMRSLSICLMLLLSAFATFGGLDHSTLLNGAEPIGIRIYPEVIDLTNRDSSQRVTIQWRIQSSDASSNATTGNEILLSSQLNVSVEDPAIAAINLNSEKERFEVIALKDGQTKLLVSGLLPNGIKAEASAIVRCKQVREEQTIEFNNHVQSVLARNGCNMGACHGALAGKGGFRLSLRGYDPVTDYFNITRQDRGRRIELAEPAKSLLIAKPSGAIEHKGGLRLPSDSRDYQLLARWIATVSN